MIIIETEICIIPARMLVQAGVCLLRSNFQNLIRENLLDLWRMKMKIWNICLSVAGIEFIFAKWKIIYKITIFPFAFSIG